MPTSASVGTWIFRTAIGCTLLLGASSIKAQEIVIDSIAWVIVDDPSMHPDPTGERFSGDTQLNVLFSSHGVIKYHRPMAFANSKRLSNICEITGSADLTPLYHSLNTTFPNVFKNFVKHERNVDTALYDPPDYHYYLATQSPGDWQWDLLKTQANLAWDITLGDPDIRMATFDFPVDGTHPDLESKLILPYDAYDPSETFDCDNPDVFWHGVAVAGFAGAETAETGQSPIGRNASAAFKCKLVAYSSTNGVSTNTFLAKALHSSTVMGARTITSCAGSGIPCSVSSGMIPYIQDVMAEIFDNGTCIVYPAGNGLGGYHCGSPGNYQPVYPFHPMFDERVIIVTATDNNDMHQYFTGGGVEHTYSEFPDVDICAPGYGLMGLVPTNCDTNGWPYGGNSSGEYMGGTSFASPIVASICALVMSVEPCLGAEDVQAIIKATADPVADAANYPGMLGAGRINAYQACLMAQSYGHYAPIASSQTWNDNYFIKDDLVVTTGAVLTITGKLRFSDGAKLIIQQGAKVVVDGGILTKAQGCHNSFWPGIEVWGTTTQHQEPANHPSYQGLLVLKNGAVIEHALTGFINWKPDDWNSLGGVLQVQGTLDDVGGTFHNCQIGAEFMEYHNFYPSSPSHAEKNDNSYFRHAAFIVDDDYRGNDDFDSHVRMWMVKGISFQQCDFINAQTTNASDLSEPLGWGIYSFDAGFSVTGQCAEQLPPCEYGSGQPEPVCPEESLRPSRFIGLDHAIRAGSSGLGGYTFTVKDSYFENNVCGIYTDAVNNAAILRNKFIVGGRQVTLNGDDANFDYKHRGIFTTQANAFRVEENRFSKASVTYAGTEGVVIGYTSAYSNQVYKNTSSDMDHAFVAEGSNVDALHPTTTGLSFLCNQNAQNGEEDFKIRTNVQGNPPPDHSIKMFQGSTTKSAGNTFTPQQNGSSPYYNYHNEAEVLPITYFWELSPGDLNSGAYNAPWVQRNANSSSHNTCPTRILCGGGVGPVRTALSPLIEQERLAYLNLKYVFESLLDGGDFDDLKETIMESWPSDAWQLRNELIDKSPYLSTDILKETRVKNILPDAMYLEVCLANPEATQRDGFVKWVQFEAPVPLPEYMVAQVVASWDQRTWRTSLESEMGWHNGEYQRLNDELTRAMLTDSVAQPADSILVRWQHNPSLRARFGEVNTMLGQNRFDEAVALLEGLDANYILEKQGKQDRDDILDLIAVFRPVIEGSGRTLMQLEPGELTALEEIAERQPSLAASYARNTLCYGYDICIPPVTGGVMQLKMLWANVSGTEAATVPLLIVHPNPASTWVAFSHTIPAKINQAQIRVLDPLGRVVHEAGIKTSPDQVIWDTRKIAAGSYMVELYNAGRLLDAQRVVVKP
ncbi:MAG: S8 family peptidase [Flavobacteriales bacterium]|nr:S8 family peptidase [Flavobacteriales bacterium]